MGDYNSYNGTRTKDKRAAALAMLLSDPAAGYCVVARVFNVSAKTVAAWAQRAGVAPTAWERAHYAAQQRAAQGAVALAAYNEGRSLLSIAQELGIGRDRVRVLLHDAGVTRIRRQPLQAAGKPTCQRCEIVLEESDLSFEDGTEIHPADDPGAKLCWLCREELAEISAMHALRAAGYEGPWVRVWLVAMHAVYQSQPTRRCETCRHLQISQVDGEYKCAVYGMAAGMRNVWSPEWPACGAWNKSQRILESVGALCQSA